jgi:hypothetical protein
MPPAGYLARDLCWLEVITHSRSAKIHPEVICIHCQKIWFSNSRMRVVEHLKDCKELPLHLWEKYQPSRLQSQESPVKKRKQSSSWMDRMENSEAELLDELLAEFFYGAGIALSLVSDSYNEITYYISY